MTGFSPFGAQWSSPDKVHIQDFIGGWLVGTGAPAPGDFLGPALKAIQERFLRLTPATEAKPSIEPAWAQRQAKKLLLETGNTDFVFNLRALVPVADSRTIFIIWSFISESPTWLEGNDAGIISTLCGWSTELRSLVLQPAVPNDICKLFTSLSFRSLMHEGVSQAGSRPLQTLKFHVKRIL